MLIPRLPPKNGNRSITKSVNALIPRLTSSPRTPIPREKQQSNVDAKGRMIFRVGENLPALSPRETLGLGLGPIDPRIASRVKAEQTVRKPAPKPQSNIIVDTARAIPRALTSFALPVFQPGRREFLPTGRFSEAVLGPQVVKSPSERINQGAAQFSQIAGAKPGSLPSYLGAGIGIAGITALDTTFTGKAAGKIGREIAERALKEIGEQTGQEATAELARRVAKDVLAETAGKKLVKEQQEAILRRVVAKNIELPKELEPLAQEARKYKSAEEFANNTKSSDVVYRGDTGKLKSSVGESFVTPDKEMAKSYGDKVTGFVFKDKGKVLDLTNDGVRADYIRSLYSPKERAQLQQISDYLDRRSLSGSSWNLKKAIKDTFPTIGEEPASKMAIAYDGFTTTGRGGVYSSWTKIIEKAKKDGFNTIKHTGEDFNKSFLGDEYVALNPSKQLTPLTDIWKQAQGGGTASNFTTGSSGGNRTRITDLEGRLPDPLTDGATTGLAKKGDRVKGQKLPQSVYDGNRSKGVDESTLKKMISGAGKSFKSALTDSSKTLDKVLGSISTRLKNIDPSLKTAMRTFEFKVAGAIQKDRRVAKGWLKGINKLSSGDYDDLDLAMKNGDIAKIESLVKHYDLQAEFKSIRAMLDDVYKRAESVGYDIGYQKDYFPRVVEDSEGLLTYFSKGDDWSIIDEAIRAKETEIARYLTVEEKAKLINTMIRGYGSGKISLSKTGAMKARTIDVVDGEINQFYADSGDALLTYIDGTNNAIEARKFFGKSGGPDQFGNIEDSIGSYIFDLVAKKKITPGQEKELRSILQARFSPIGTSGAVRVYKNLAYIDTMGTFLSAVTQIGDLAFSLYKTGPIQTVKALGKAIVGKSQITRADIGIEKIAQEFESMSGSAKLVNKMFDVTGLTKFDALGKETLINSTISRYRRLANKPSPDFIAKLKATFGQEKEILTVIDDLKAGRTTEDVKLLAFNELLDMQPVALSEMPEQYLKGGNGRVFYMLKTYTIKLFDVYRNEVFQVMKTDPAKGIRNLLALSAALVAMNATADEIKDLILNRETSLEDRVVDNILKLAGFSKFTIYRAREEGIGSAAAATILPPFKLIDSLYKDITKATEVSQLETIQSIPLGGRLYYWWFGKGRTKTDKKREDGDSGLPSLDGLDLPKLPKLDLPKLPKL